MYPDFLYRPGRKKVLHHFLSMERIFKTDEFATKFEAEARISLGRELGVVIGSDRVAVLGYAPLSGRLEYVIKVMKSLGNLRGI